MKTYDEPVTFCHRCGLFNDEAKNIKWNNVMDATISTSVGKFRLTYVVYFVKSKIGPSESCDTSYSDHWEMDNQGWGSKKGIQHKHDGTW